MTAIIMSLMCSDDHSSMWLSFAPEQPEQHETVRAKRVSNAPATSAVLPLRERPTAAARLASRSGSVSTQSRTRLMPHAHAEIIPHSVGFRSSRFCGPNTLNTPVVATSAPFQSSATSWLQ